MKYPTFVLFFLLLIPPVLQCQTQFVANGENAITVGSSWARNEGLATLSVSAIATFIGRFDLGMSYSFLDYDGTLKEGKAVSVSLAANIIRRDSAGTYATIHASYVWANSTGRYTGTFGGPYTVEEHSTAPSIGLSLGVLRGTLLTNPGGVSIHPNAGVSLAFPGNAEGTVVSYGFGFAFLIPISERGDLAPSFSFVHSRNAGIGVDNIGLVLSYTFNLSK